MRLSNGRKKIAKLEVVSNVQVLDIISHARIKSYKPRLKFIYLMPNDGRILVTFWKQIVSLLASPPSIGLRGLVRELAATETHRQRLKKVTVQQQLKEPIGLIYSFINILQCSNRYYFS